MTHCEVKQTGRVKCTRPMAQRGLDKLCCISETANSGLYLQYF